MCIVGHGTSLREGLSGSFLLVQPPTSKFHPLDRQTPALVPSSAPLCAGDKAGICVQSGDTG